MYRLWCRLCRSDVSERSCDSHNDRRERGSAGQCDHTGAAAGSDRDSYSVTYTNANTDRYIYADPYAVSHPHPQADADPYTRADAYSDTDPNEVRYGYQPESA